MLLSLATTITVNSFAKDQILKKDENGGTSYYEEVVKAPGLKQDELFKRAKTWIIANLKTGDNNITFDEKDFSAVNTGAMKVKTMHSLGVVIHDGYFDFKFQVLCKYERYKIRLDNVMFYVVVSATMAGTTIRTYSYDELKDGKLDRHLRDDANTKLAALVAKFNADMSHAQADPKKGDW